MDAPLATAYQGGGLLLQAGCILVTVPGFKPEFHGSN